MLSGQCPCLRLLSCLDCDSLRLPEVTPVSNLREILQALRCTDIAFSDSGLDEPRSDIHGSG